MGKNLMLTTYGGGYLGHDPKEPTINEEPLLPTGITFETEKPKVYEAEKPNVYEAEEPLPPTGITFETEKS